MPQRRRLGQMEHVEVAILIVDSLDLLGVRIEVLEPRLAVLGGLDQVDPPPLLLLDDGILKVGVPLFESAGRVVEEPGQSGVVAEQLLYDPEQRYLVRLRVVVTQATEVDDPVVIVVEAEVSIEFDRDGGLLETGLPDCLNLAAEYRVGSGTSHGTTPAWASSVASNAVHSASSCGIARKWARARISRSPRAALICVL